MVEPVVEDDTYVEYDVVDRGGHAVGVLDEVVCVLWMEDINITV